METPGKDRVCPPGREATEDPEPLPRPAVPQSPTSSPQHVPGTLVSRKLHIHRTCSDGPRKPAHSLASPHHLLPQRVWTGRGCCFPAIQCIKGHLHFRIAT